MFRARFNPISNLRITFANADQLGERDQKSQARADIGRVDRIGLFIERVRDRRSVQFKPFERQGNVVVEADIVLRPDQYRRAVRTQARNDMAGVGQPGEHRLQ